MKIVITSQGPDMNSAVDPRFGRAACFITVDSDTGEFTAYDNSTGLNAAQGAGVQAGRYVADLGVKAVITGQVGPKAFATLAAAGVTVYTGASGTVQEALESYKSGQLSAAAGASVQGRWS